MLMVFGVKLAVFRKNDDTILERRHSKSFCREIELDV